MPPAVGLSRFLANGFIPLCTWGMLSALMLHLIEVRSLFIEGGEDRLRLAVLAFSLGVVLSQRLAAQQGSSVANSYRWGLGGAMGLFTLYHAFAYKLPVHPLLVALANGVIFTALWWAGTRITAACSVDSDEGTAAAAETGILGRRKRLRSEPENVPWSASGRGKIPAAPGSSSLTVTEAEKLWRERLPAQHPGRVIFLFSLFAIPAFGLGVFLFDSQARAEAHLGIHLFFYLWCTLALLFLSSHNQLAAYFDRRQVSLPDLIGSTWLALGFLIVSVVVPLAFLLPQPPSPAGLFLRERITASYEGLESKYGMKEELSRPAPNPGSAENPGADAVTPDPGAVQQRQAADSLGKEAGLDKAYVIRDSGEGRVQAAKDGLQKIFDFFLKVMLILAGLAGMIVIIVVVAVLWIGLRAQLATLRPLRRRREAKERKREQKQKLREASAAFRTFQNPFAPGAAYDDEDLVRYLWHATLAWCEQSGAPCDPDQTPYEYLNSSPAPLQGFEAPAQRLAHWLMHVEFSNQPLPTRAFEELRDYWEQLTVRAQRG